MSGFQAQEVSQTNKKLKYSTYALSGEVGIYMIFNLHFMAIILNTSNPFLML